MNDLSVIIKILISGWLLIVSFIPGNCMYSFNANGNSWRRNHNPIISYNHFGDIKCTKLKNMELVGKNNKDLKKYHCSVTEGISLPVDLVRGGHAGGLVNGHVIVTGGTDWSKDKTTKYWLKNTVVLKNGKWIDGPDLPKPLAYAMYGCDDKSIYVAGGTSDGKSGSNEVYMLSSINKNAEWKTLPNLPEAVIFGAGVVFNDKFYVTCGSVNDQSINNMWSLDLNHIENGWNECKSVPGAGRVLPAFVACGKYLYLVGGLKEFSPLEPLNDLYRYCPDKDEWERLKDLPLKGYAWVTQPIDDNYLLLTGRADGIVHNGIWIIDLENSSMNEVGHLVIPAATAPLVKVTDEYFWLIGGEPDSNKNRTGKVSVVEVRKEK